VSWLSRLKNAVRPRRLDADLADEMRDHCERRAAALRAKGLNAEEAQRQADVRFGNVTRLREESRAIRLWAGLEGTLQDVRYAWRGMRKGPAFAATAVLSLALAIGANTAIYSIVDAAILRPLPVPAPNELFRLSSPGISDPGGPAAQERASFSYPMYLQFAAVSKEAARLTLFSDPQHVEAQGATTEKITRQFVSEDAFEVLGVSPAAGRLLMPQGRAVVVLSYDYWRKRFQADPGVVGRNLRIEGKAYEIVGVARAGFFGVEPGRFIDAWLPASVYDAKALAESGWNWFQIVGRLRPGVSRERVAARLQPIFHRFQMERANRVSTMPPSIKEQLLRSAIQVHAAATGVTDFQRTFARPLWIVFGVAAGILLIACANVASLLLARAMARAPEMAMRVSLGAARTRLIRQMLTESLLLSLLAGGLGWLLARAGGPLLVSLLSRSDDPVEFALAIDTRVLLFCVGVSMLSAILFGLVPAWQASGAQPMTSLKTSAGQVGKLRLGKLFVTIQVACAFCLLMAGAAFLFSLGKLFHVDPGFDARNVAVLNVTTEAGKKTREAQRALMFQLQSRIGSQSGVEAAALAAWPIFLGSGWEQQVILPGKGPSEQEEIFYRVSPRYFATLHTRLPAGRDFEPRDSRAQDLEPAIVNAAFARKYFNNLNVLGREFSRQFGNSAVRSVIVGVASDAHYNDLRHTAEPIVYLPTEGSDGFTLYLRSPLPLGALVRIVDSDAHAIGSGMRVRDVSTLETIVGNTLLREKLLAVVGGAFAFFGLLLAGIGLFGLLSYSVGRRTKEIGIRTALGAQRTEMIWLVLKDVSGLMSGGLVIGLTGALAVMSLLRSLLFEIRMADPLVIGTAMGLFLATGLLAASLPAHRAATVDPMLALREE
jgi:predicted permease